MKYGTLTLSLCTLLIAGNIFFSDPDYKQYMTLTGQIDTVKLPDGTVITLGAASQIRVAEFGGGQRDVILDYGEALFSVAKDASRPFTVTMDTTRIRVLGTVFNVNKRQGGANISLMEGQVRIVQEMEGKIIPFLTTEETINLNPAEQISVKAGLLQPVQPKNIAHMASWAKGRLRYEGVALRDVVADLNRYSVKPVRIGDASINSLPVTAVFGVDQIEDMIEALPDLIPVKLIKTADRYILYPKGAADI